MIVVEEFNIYDINLLKQNIIHLILSIIDPLLILNTKVFLRYWNIWIFDSMEKGIFITHRYTKFHPGQDSRCYPGYSQRWRGRQLQEYVFLELAFRCWPRATFHHSAWISKCLWSWPGHHRGRTHSEYARLLTRPRWNHVHDRRCTELNHLPREFWTGRWKKYVNGKRKYINFIYHTSFVENIYNRSTYQIFLKACRQQCRQ